MHASDWENVARCAEARYEALYQEAMETGKRTSHDHRTLVTWGALHDCAVRDLETCLAARLMASIPPNRFNPTCFPLHCACSLR